jgi:diguanylate cyclase (GGDEF)-like protein
MTMQAGLAVELPTAQNPERRILIIDDDVDFAESLQELLKLEGYSTTLANDSESALRSIAQSAPEVALIDITLNGQSGVELLERVAVDYPETVCIMVTGNAATDTAVQALRCQAHDYLRKPVDIDALLGTLNRAFEKLRLQAERDLAQTQLAQQATYDSLTGLVNRREFEHRLQRVLNTAWQLGTQNALCYLDLDQFKVVNDTSGHLAGDELLRQVSQLLQSQVRKRDTLARLGGDEFAVLVEGCTLQQAERVATALREAIADFRFRWEDRTFTIGVSIGLVPVNTHSETLTEVLRAADAACYAAKERGRNRIHACHPDDQQLSKRHDKMRWVSKINAALEQDRFTLCVQRIVPLAETNLDGELYEFLLRMRDERGETILPHAFLPAAERYNLMPRIDQWVLASVFDWFTRYPEELENLALFTMNLSGHSLGSDELAQQISRHFEESSVPPTKACFEITETAAISNVVRARQIMQELKARGCSFALDDFGSGLSSFAYLKTLPVDYIKIDGVLVRDIVNDPVDLAMVKSINEVAHVLGKRTIAEFVEDELVLERLRQIGVDFAQGYAISRPVAIDDRRQLPGGA